MENERVNNMAVVLAIVEGEGGEVGDGRCRWGGKEGWGGGGCGGER